MLWPVAAFVQQEVDTANNFTNTLYDKNATIYNGIVFRNKWYSMSKNRLKMEFIQESVLHSSLSYINNVSKLIIIRSNTLFNLKPFWIRAHIESNLMHYNHLYILRDKWKFERESPLVYRFRLLVVIDTFDQQMPTPMGNFTVRCAGEELENAEWSTASQKRYFKKSGNYWVILVHLVKSGIIKQLLHNCSVMFSAHGHGPDISFC